MSTTNGITTNLRHDLVQFLRAHSKATVMQSMPYTVAILSFDGTEGLGFAKWNPHDKETRYAWNEQRGKEIALGRAALDLYGKTDISALVATKLIIERVAVST